MFKSLKECQEFIKQNEVQIVDFKMVDIDGRWRHVSIPASYFTEKTVKNGIGFDGSNYGYANVENSDMVYLPDLSTAFLNPFTRVKTLSMTGDAKIIGKENFEDFNQYPRNVLRKATQYMKNTGIADEMLILPEFEFYIFDNVDLEIADNKVHYYFDCYESDLNGGMNMNGYQLKSKTGYHTDIPNDSNDDIRSQICVDLENNGVKIKYHHHEVGGCGQQEIEVQLCEVNKMADQTMLIKYFIKNEVLKENKTVTFMPKPIHGHAGSGMHVHMLLKKDGNPVFYGEEGYANLSQEALWFIGGLLKHAKSLCAVTNPSTNSYKRLVPGFEAPVTIGYAMANRSAVIRIPAYVKNKDEKRFELRNPDATANPYYAYAAILMAGLDGIENEIDPADYNWGPFDFNLFDLPEEEKQKIDSLPSSLDEALNALEEDHQYLLKGNVFTEDLLRLWIKRKRKEAKEINEIPNPAEISRYFDL